ncbi:MAG: hypothetical protein KJ755_16335, partial [Alphaproteobacteria bacterium]|nr:hypothetical protein [Alphaproteobacteria bacterium]
EMGWDGITEHYRTNWPCIARWVDECGGDELRRARAEHVAKVGKKRLHFEPVRGSRGSNLHATV